MPCIGQNRIDFLLFFSRMKTDFYGKRVGMEEKHIDVLSHIDFALNFPFIH